MISNLFETTITLLNDYLGKKGAGSPLYQALTEDISQSEKGGDNGGQEEWTNRIVATLVSIEEETSLKNNYPVRQVGSSFVTEKSSVFVNLYVLFSANYEMYPEGLKIIAEVVNFFQSTRRISFAVGEEQLEAVFSLYNIGFENLNNLWTVLGGRYKPSVIYKARVLMYQASPPAAGSAILDIRETGNLS